MSKQGVRAVAGRQLGPRRSMRRFYAIEGLRGWLAWAVVLSHIAQTSDVYAKGLGPAMGRAGHAAVLVFVVISGFVITHLVITRPEPYRIFLLRRFMRIFPLFAVTCVAGFYTNDIHAVTVSRVSWAADPAFAEQVTAFTGIAHSDHDFFWANALAHLTLIHGAISETLLPYSLYAFNTPAWSLSLEWQFYLIAPLAIMLARQQRTVVWLALAIAVVESAYQFGWLGLFSLPSFLPGAAGYFALGMASRLVHPIIVGTVRYPNMIFALCIVLIPLGADAVPILVWTLVMTGLLLSPAVTDASTFVRIYQRFLESRVATYFGSRSYSTYLCHWPIIVVCHALWLALIPMASRASTFFAVAAMAVPLTLIVSELLYRGIEQPGMALGAWLVRRSEPVAMTS
jgi:peptidoglycan/LPS O-acetylase OafA/YrhL